MAAGGTLSRRGFVGLLGVCAAGVSLAARRGPTQRLASRNGARVSGGVQHYRSRPDLLPPEVTIDVPPKAVAPGLVLTDAHNGPAQQGPLLVDSNGEIVFFKGLSSAGSASLRAFNVRLRNCWAISQRYPTYIRSSDRPTR